MRKRITLAVAATIVIGCLVRLSKLTGDANEVREVTQTGSMAVTAIRSIRADLDRIVTPADDPVGGYFVYHEGPHSDWSRSTREPSDVGDTDDYLAFTVMGRPDSFSANVPWGVLEAARAQQSGGDSGDSYEAPPGYDPLSTRSIQSAVAEVAYWIANDPSGNALVRRTLPIRPDLNVTRAQLEESGIPVEGFDGLSKDQPVLGCMRADGVVEPCGWSMPELDAGLWQSESQHWLGGIANVQQTCGISIAREMQHDASGLSTGHPSRFYSANSLERTRQPHRRFAHVMVPSANPDLPPSVEGRASTEVRASSMPILALDRSDLVSRPDDRTGVIIGRYRSDDQHDEIAADLLAMDVQLFDVKTPVYITCGDDREPGVRGADDNGNGIVDHAPGDPAEKDVGELGAINSDDRITTPSDAEFYPVVRGKIFTSRPISRGSFVDLAYALQLGGQVRFDTDRFSESGTFIQSRFFPWLATEYSGILISGTTENPVARVALGSAQRCVVVSDTSGPIYLQHTIDSWADRYENGRSAELRPQISERSHGRLLVKSQSNRFGTVPPLSESPLSESTTEASSAVAESVRLRIAIRVRSPGDAEPTEYSIERQVTLPPADSQK